MAWVGCFSHLPVTVACDRYFAYPLLNMASDNAPTNSSILWRSNQLFVSLTSAPISYCCFLWTTIAAPIIYSLLRHMVPALIIYGWPLPPTAAPFVCMISAPINCLFLWQRSDQLVLFSIDRDIRSNQLLVNVAYDSCFNYLLLTSWPPTATLVVPLTIGLIIYSL